MKMHTIQAVGELEALRGYWERWQLHPNSDFSQFEMVCRLRPEVECPCVTVIEEDNRPYALLLGRLERTQFAPAIGYLKPMKISAKVIAVIHQGLLGYLDAESARRTLHHLSSLLRSGLADGIEFHFLSEESPILEALRAHGSRWLREEKTSWSVHREMAIPVEGTIIEHKVRSKHRSWLRKKLRELESTFQGRISWRWLKTFDDVPGLCARIEEVATRTYQRGLGSGFVNNEEYRQRFALYAQRGQLRVQLLEIDGRVQAFWYGTVYQGVFHSSETGYNPDLRRYEVGTLIFLRMVDELAQEGVRKLDFGLGDAHYKQRFGDHSWREKSVWMFAPTAKGVFLRSILRLSGMIDSSARGIVQRTKLIDRLRTRWRRSLEEGDARAK